MLCTEFSKKKIENYYIVPIAIDQNFTPALISNENREEINKFINNISKPIINNTITWNWWFEEIAGKYLWDNLKSWGEENQKIWVKTFFEIRQMADFFVHCQVLFRFF